MSFVWPLWCKLYGKRHIETFKIQFKAFFNNDWNKLNILPFSLSGQEILTKLHIRKSWTKIHKNSHKINIPTIPIVGIIGIRVLNMILYGFYSRMFRVIWPIIWYITLIILSWNQLWRYFPCSWFNLNLKIIKLGVVCIKCTNCKKISIFKYQHQCHKTLFQFLSNSFCFMTLVSCGWYKLGIKLSFMLMKNLPIGLKIGHGIM